MLTTLLEIWKKGTAVSKTLWLCIEMTFDGFTADKKYSCGNVFQILKMSRSYNFDKKILFRKFLQFFTPVRKNNSNDAMHWLYENLHGFENLENNKQ